MKRRSTIGSIFERGKEIIIIRILFVKAKTSFFWENKIFTLKECAGEFFLSILLLGRFDYFGGDYWVMTGDEVEPK